MADPIRWAKRLGAVAVLLLVAAAVDPLEGFPLVLAGGALAVISARLAESGRFRLLAWGLALAAFGCAALVGMSVMGGVGGSTGRPLAWAWLAAPYPVGWLILIAGCIPMVWSFRQLRGQKPHSL